MRSCRSLTGLQQRGSCSSVARGPMASDFPWLGHAVQREPLAVAVLVMDA